MKVQNRYHCPSKCRTVTVSANWHKQAYVISLKYMYTYGLYNSKGTVLRCVSCLYKSQYFLLEFLLNIFFFCDFLDNALYIIRTRLGNVCVKMYLWYCYSAMVVILCAAALTSQWGTRLYYMNDSPIVSHCYS